MNTRTSSPAVLLWPGLLLLAGCVPADQDAIGPWLQAERQAVQPHLKPLPEPVPVRTQAYAGAGLPEPFGVEQPGSSSGATPAVQRTPPAWVTAELKRSRQPLEAFALESMVMVGSLESQGERLALVMANQWLYVVRTGAYLGHNHGRIQRITDHEVSLRELVQQPSGGWIERPASLTLHEGSSK